MPEGSAKFLYLLHSVNIRIRIHRIHMFLGLLDPDPDPSVNKHIKKNLEFYCFVTSF